ncbi:MAG: DNA double-strand break repair nuclease NurA [Promethearchaeota archaeon]
MTIKNTFSFFDENEKDNSKYDYSINQKIGFTKEQLLFKNLKEIANDYLKIEETKKEFIKLIQKNRGELDFSEFIEDPYFDIKENVLTSEMIQANIRGLNVASVDGSSVVKHFMNADFSFLKAICVKYYFYKNDSSKIKYYPDVSGYNNYLVQGNFINMEENNVDAQISMDMNFMEINLLNDLIEISDNLDLIIIDGSIVPMPINLIFGRNDDISHKYDNLLREYRRLYANCTDKDIILIGSIKDTRTSALIHSLRSGIQILKPNTSRLSDFIKINYRQIINYFSDLDFFTRLLNKSERSCIFNCKKDMKKIRESGIKKEIPDYFPYNFYAFYLKTVKHDTPCRIEFFTNEDDTIKEASEKANLISSIILPISIYNENYGLPIPQIEAHRRAVFKPSEINLLFNNLARNFSKNGITLLDKRRARRPF